MKKSILKRLSCILLLFILFVLPLTAADINDITPVTTEIYDGHSYALYDEGLDWNSAREFCEKQGGYLATITSEAEQSIIEGLISYGEKKQYWLGATDAKEEGTWAWITDEAWNYANWDRGMPDNNIKSGDEDYLQIYSTPNPHAERSSAYKWNDITANNMFPQQSDFFITDNVGFICEWGEPRSDEDAEQKAMEEEIKSLFNNITFVNDTLRGPAINFFGKKFYLFERNICVSLDLGSLNLNFDHYPEEKKVRIVLGADLVDENALMTPDENREAIKKSYQEVKSFYQKITGKKVDSSKLYQDYLANRKTLQTLNANFLVDANCEVGGFVELSYETGKFNMSEGGMVVCISIGGEFNVRVPGWEILYGAMGLTVDVKGGFSLHKCENDEAMAFKTDIESELAANIGLGGGFKKLWGFKDVGYLEGGLIGGLKVNFSAATGCYAANHKNYTPLKIDVFGDVYFKGGFMGFAGELRYNLTTVTLYPNNEPHTLEALSFDDFKETATPLPRDYLYKMQPLSLTQADGTFKKSSVYGYNEPVITTLSDNSLLLLWIDDTGEKNDINKTSLMHSISNGNIWSAPQEIFETGTYNGAPVLFNDGEHVHIIWSRAKTAFESDAQLEDLISDVELFYTKFDGTSFSNPIQITDNNVLEAAYTITAKDGKVAVAWIENSANDPFLSEGNNSFYIKEYIDNSWQPTCEVITSEETIANAQLFYFNDALYNSYERITDNAESKIYLNSSLLATGTNLCYENGTVYYLTDNGVIEYALNSGAATNTGISNISNFSVYNGKIYTLMQNGFASELYEAKKTNGSYSAFKQITDCGKYIRNYSITADNTNGNTLLALNLVEVNENETSLYGDSELTVLGFAQITDLSLNGACYDIGSLTSNSTSLPITMQISNLGNQTVNSIPINISVNGKYVKTIISKTACANGKSQTITYTCPLPTPIKKTTITLTIPPQAGEKNIDNNSFELTLGQSDLSVSNLAVKKVNSIDAVTGVVINEGFEVAKNTVVNVFDSENNLLSVINCGNLPANRQTNFTYILPEKYLSLDNQISKHNLYFNVSTESSEESYGNNDDKIAFGELTLPTVIMVDDKTNIIDIVDISTFKDYDFSRSGYTFTGWYLTPGFAEYEKIDPSSYSACKDTILYAKLEKDPSQVITSGRCGTNATWQLNTETGTLKISGYGLMFDYGNGVAAPWKEYSDNIETIIIDSQIRRLGENVFSNCNNLKSIKILSPVLDIKNSAFKNCTQLSELVCFSDSIGEGYAKQLNCTVSYLGDNDNDGVLSVKDVLISINTFLNKTDDKLTADINGDDVVTLLDIIRLLNGISSNITPSEAGDLDSDGKLTVADVLIILDRIINGKTFSTQADINYDKKVSLLDAIMLFKTIAILQ